MRKHGYLILDGRNSLPESTLDFRLDRVILASNGIDVIPPLKENDAPLCNLTSLSLAQNNLSKWLDIDRLSLWCPALETLSLIGNPIYEGMRL